MVELINQTINETAQEAIQYAVGKLELSPPSPRVGLVGNLILMAIGLFILIILYIKFRQLGKAQAQQQQNGPLERQ